MRDRDKLRRVKRANEVQSETLDEYRNTIKFLELKLLRLENEIEQAKEMEKTNIKDAFEMGQINAYENHNMDSDDYYLLNFKSE